MTALALILGLLGAAALVAWLAGRLVRVPAPVCSQDCRQGRDCSCGAREVEP